MDGRTDGRTDKRTDERTNRKKLARLCLPAKAGATIKAGARLHYVCNNDAKFQIDCLKTAEVDCTNFSSCIKP